MDATVICNHIPRDVLDACELTTTERAKFDYLDWNAIERGEESASFFRYKGETYDLGDTPVVPRNLPADSVLRGWDGYIGDSFFTGVLVRYADDRCETVVVARYYA